MINSSEGHETRKQRPAALGWYPASLESLTNVNPRISSSILIFAGCQSDLSERGSEGFLFENLVS